MVCSMPARRKVTVGGRSALPVLRSLWDVRGCSVRLLLKGNRFFTLPKAKRTLSKTLLER